MEREDSYLRSQSKVKVNMLVLVLIDILDPDPGDLIWLYSNTCITS